jgi:hypothetical protein
MPPVGQYHNTYLGNADRTTPVTTTLGKNMINLHTEFTVHKATGESAIRMVQVTSLGIFHSEEELCAIIACTLYDSAPNTYGPEIGPSTEEETASWLAHMPNDPEVLPEADPVRVADKEALAWCSVRATEQHGESKPILVTEIVGRAPHNLGWVPHNAFSALDPNASTLPTAADIPLLVSEHV